MAKRSLGGKILSFLLGKMEKKVMPIVEADIARKFRAAGAQADTEMLSFQGKEGIARMEAHTEQTLESIRISIAKLLDDIIRRSGKSFWRSFIAGLLLLASIFFFLLR